jgi:serine/threonine protein kinase
MTCSQCSTNNPDNAPFCSECGREFGLPAAATAILESGRDPGSSPTVPLARFDDDEETRISPTVVSAGGAAAAPVREKRKEPEATHVLPVTPAANATTLIGRIIEGKYRLDSLVGEGGMGAVYKAHRLLIGDDVAIKILHPEHMAESQANERFRREAQAAARLKHPNAVSIYDFGVTSDGLVYLVSEFVEGQNLREIIKQQGPLTASVAAEINNQVCSALAEAHRQQIVHRDLKPDNIIVNPTVRGLSVKVLDFGIAKLRDVTVGNLTQTGSVMGTPRYMSPEQCLGEDLDSRSDIYSFGVVVFEMLAGVAPFNAPISTAVVVMQVNQAPPSLRTINVSISPAVEAVVLHALAKRPEDRPQTAEAFAADFAAAVRGPLPVPQRSAPLNVASDATLTPTIAVGRVPGGTSAGQAQYTPGAPWTPAVPSKTRNMVVPLIIVASIALLALVALVAVLVSGRLGNQSANGNTNVNSNPQSANPPVNSSTPEIRPFAEKPERTPARIEPTPIMPVVNPSVARSEVTSAMNVWADSLRRRSVSDNLSLYADRLEVFYGMRNVDKSSVRSNRQTIFNKYYSSTDVQLSNMRVEVDASGSRANVFYDNEYSWQGGARSLSGKSHNQIIMSRINGRWLITSEIHLQQYYERKQD